MYSQYENINSILSNPLTEIAMEISDLKIFSAVAESGSITQAAKKLHRVPSNVSTRIQKLETAIGQSLFIRENNRLHISPAGKSLLGYAQQILNLADQAVSQFQNQEPNGELRVGAMEAVAATYLTQYLAPFHQNFPSVILNVKTLHTEGLIESVLKGELDLACVANPTPHDDLESLSIIKEPMTLVSSLNTKQLKHICEPIRLLGFTQGCYYRKSLIEWAQLQEINYSLHEIQSYHSLLNCVSAGMGIGITPKSLLNQFHDKDKIQTHPLPKHLKYTYTHLIWRKGHVSAAMQAFINLVKQKKPSI